MHTVVVRTFSGVGAIPVSDIILAEYHHQMAHSVLTRNFFAQKAYQIAGGSTYQALLVSILYFKISCIEVYFSKQPL